MAFRLRPQEPEFYDLFGEAGRNLVVAARLVQELASAPPAERAGVVERLREVEHAGDDVTHRILKKVNTSFVTPFDREDIYALASRIDDVLDLMEEAGDRVVLYDVDGLPAKTREVADVLLAASEQTADALPRLRSMKGLESYWIEVNRLENEADRLYRDMIGDLFRSGADALHVMKVKEVLDTLEAAADALEHVADAVQTVVAKES
ncbi:hypothetical protein EV189_1776 [Motilibacter rhizosphaerae]|uniref:Phosphate transport regulator n=1 Tax=Motilibacter rhizosphaerae TaxID=598652 RepID=A0A4Q7NSP2_9ACTN|nr:DUF47 family protein [Motilibacter rhizosphaerae]RZS89994.1 hypothetical protein EV189_1776 [Motilibacter rhizosphaerae]